MPIAHSIVPQFAQVVTIDFADVPTVSSLTEEVTVAGALVDHIYLAIPEGTWNEGLSYPIGTSKNAGKVTFRILNPTAGNLDPVSQDFKILGF